MNTQLALLTPPGKAAIATLAVRGPQAWSIACQLFQRRTGPLPEQPNAGQFWFGRLIDDVVLAFKSSDHVELHCHGGVEIVRLIEEQFAALGVRVVDGQERMSPLEKMLAHAPTARTAAILLDQCAGAWKRRGQDAEAQQRLRDLIPLGRHLVEPWKIVIAGAPNVGKSSLMNALAGFTRSLVATTPGTTRDLVSVRLAIDGWPVELIDTAGVRESTSSIEGQGIERAREAMCHADLRVWVMDGSSEPVMADAGDWLMVINKIDLPAAWDWSSAGASRVSAQTNAGLDELCAAISRRLVAVPPQPGAAVPCLPEHFEWINDFFAGRAR